MDGSFKLLNGNFIYLKDDAAVIDITVVTDLDNFLRTIQYELAYWQKNRFPAEAQVNFLETYIASLLNMINPDDNPVNTAGQAEAQLSLFEEEQKNKGF
jgi:hypothetical protein